jgi:hypothetical protein
MQVLASYIEIYQESIRDLLLETTQNDDPNKPKVCIVHIHFCKSAQSAIL